MATSFNSLTELFAIVEARFLKYPNRHLGLTWISVKALLDKQPNLLSCLLQMEQTGGMPDVFLLPNHPGYACWIDSSPESPSGRRSLCYDQEARLKRKEFTPEGSAVEMATDMGVRLLDESEYLALQHYEAFDQKTSSWLHTPAELRSKGGALFGDLRYNRTFIYHNGVQSYYASRGFRGILLMKLDS